MRCHALLIGLAVVSLAAAAPACAAPATADAVADCNQFEDPARQVRGCTAFIRHGTLQTDALASAYINRGIAQGHLGRNQRAVADFSEAIKLDPTSALAYYNRGNAHYDLGKFDAALGDYDAAISREPDFALAYFNRGLTREKHGDRERAIADFMHALMLDPELQAARDKLQGLGVKPQLDAASGPAG